MSLQSTESRAGAAYVGYFILAIESGRLEAAIAWRRESGCDYGIYLEKPATGGSGPSCSVFKACYKPSGEAFSFLVADAWPSDSGRWDGDHLAGGAGGEDALLMEPGDADALLRLSSDFVGEWLESYGEAEVAAMLKFVAGSNLRSEGGAWMGAISSGLPAEVRQDKMPDVLSVAECDSNGSLRALVGRPEHVAMEDSSWTAEQLARMRLFFDLL